MWDVTIRASKPTFFTIAATNLCNCLTKLYAASKEPSMVFGQIAAADFRRMRLIQREMARKWFGLDAPHTTILALCSLPATKADIDYGPRRTAIC